jgi:hypothetical protein
MAGDSNTTIPSSEIAGVLPCGWGFAGSRAPVPSERRIVTGVIRYGAPSSSSRKMKRVERLFGQ